jgi:FlaA1/EpsC-like NDP-sugar epimerase
MINSFKKFPFLVILISDILLLTSSITTSFFIRFDFNYTEVISQKNFIFINHVLVFIIIKIFTLFSFRVYQSIVRHSSIHDIKKIFFSLSLSSIITIIFTYISNSFFNGRNFLPYSIIIIDFFISFFLILGFRLSVKIFYIEIKKRAVLSKKFENILIYGAGVSGLITKRTIEKDTESSFNIIGFIDDSFKLKNNRLQGTKIYHTTKLETIIQDFDIKKIIFAIQRPSLENKQNVIDICIKHSVKILTVPSAKKWINGDFSTSQIKTINIEELLGRSPIYLNPEKINVEVNNKRILVTGAAGSIGSGIVKQLANYLPSKIILLDQAESQLYELEQELKQSKPDLNFDIVIGDVSNYVRMNRLYEFYKPELVFHAAAYKHVPLMEDNPSEAVYTNILGTKNLVDLSVKHKVMKFVLISTDKAVNPTNVMGASKRIAEIYAQSSSTDETKFITTRFGNVLGSNGSVIPLFKKQIEQGGPITITDNRVTRFFMTIPEACQLVLEAGTMGNGGEIFVFDMGKPVKIIDLAKKMIKLSGLEEGKDIEIKVTGLRPGEKLFEELLSKEENTIPTHHPKILKAKVRNTDHSAKIDISTLIQLFDSQNNIEIVKLMKKIVPEYISNNSEFQTLDK